MRVSSLVYQVRSRFELALPVESDENDVDT
jgi:hypothetical protein